jgi:hypothetical protein
MYPFRNRPIALDILTYFIYNTSKSHFIIKENFMAGKKLIQTHYRSGLPYLQTEDGNISE